MRQKERGWVRVIAQQGERIVIFGEQVMLCVIVYFFKVRVQAHVKLEPVDELNALVAFGPKRGPYLGKARQFPKLEKPHKAAASAGCELSARWYALGKRCQLISVIMRSEVLNEGVALVATVTLQGLAH
jgi:hypothetical protein